MKINRYKLNAILKSGLNPEIKTRKHLAAILEVDHTSVTRWFSARDRLGNPRFPVVPDRHVGTILQLFTLEPSSLELDDEAFRRHCFELALQRAEQLRKESGQTKPSRQERIAQRQLRIPPHRNRNVAKFTLASVIAVAIVIIGWQLFRVSNKVNLADSPEYFTGENCWQGYSPELGDFSEWDESDPCHYRKMLNKALQELEVNNASDSQNNSDRAVDDFIIFLSDQLDQRRINDRAKLHYELGRRAFNQFNFAEAESAFKRASEQLSLLPSPDADLGESVMRYIALANYADKPWRYARENFEIQLLSDPLWRKYWNNSAETQDQQNPLRVRAISELENGNIQQAGNLIDEVIKSDGILLGEQHFYLASDYLVKSQILSLQNNLEAARQFAEKAKRLDSELLGEHHPRVVQDQMVLVLIGLQANKFEQAASDYTFIAEFLSIFELTELPVKDMDQWLQAGITQLLAAEKSKDSGARQTAWGELHKAFVFDNPYLPRRFAAVLLNDKLQPSPR